MNSDTQKLHVTVEKEKIYRDGQSPKSRYRAHIRAEPGGPTILLSSRAQGSIVLAMRSIDDLFGELRWTRIAEDAPKFAAGFRAEGELEFVSDLEPLEACFRCGLRTVHGHDTPEHCIAAFKALRATWEANDEIPIAAESAQ